MSFKQISIRELPTWVKVLKADPVKKLGNAVTPPVMEWLVDKTIQTLI